MVLHSSYPSLIATKLQHPRIAREISRHELLARMDALKHHKLVLLSAPAGAGKTSLAVNWLETRGLAHAWYSLDEFDDDALPFLRGIIYALQPLLTAHSALRLIEGGERQVENLFGALIQDCLASPGPLILVLDDYHHLRSVEVHQWTKRLLDYAPPQLHLLITSRKALPFSVQRLRAQGQLLELKAADLAFSAHETQHLFALHHVEHMPPDQLALLHQISEGWAAGLRLLLLLHKQQRISFTRGWPGSPRAIFDYLSEQAFAQHDEAIQRFLLTTAPLRRFSLSMCQALLGIEDCTPFLHYLEQENLFLVGLDEQGIWYRYHHLFRDFLLRLLEQQQPEALPTIYRQAAQWCESRGLIEEAIDYALLSTDEKLALTLICAHGRRLIWQQAAWGQVESWIQALPPELAHQNPHIALLRASMAAQEWHFDECRRYLDIVQTCLHDPNCTLTVEERVGLQTELSALEFMFPAPRGFQVSDLARLHERMEQLDLRPWPIFQSVVLMRYADMSYLVGDFGQARQHYWRAIRTVTQQPNAAVVLNSLATLARLTRDDADWEGALAICREALDYIQHWHLTETDEARHIHMFIGILHHDAGNFEEAEQAIRAALRMQALPYRINTHIHLARALFMQGREDEALQSLYYAEDLARHHSNIAPMNYTIARTIAWVHMRQQNKAAVAQWVSQVANTLKEQTSRQPSSSDEVALLAGAEGYIALEDYGTALHLLNHLEPSCRARGRKLPLVRLKALQAAACFGLKKSKGSDLALQEALELLGESRFVGVLADIGQPLLGPFVRLMDEQGSSERLSRLLTALRQPQRKAEDRTLLSYRELEVLRLVAIGDSNQQIAQRLFLSEATVKTHLKRIYVKLEVGSRTQAVQRARDLGIL